MVFRQARRRPGARRRDGDSTGSLHHDLESDGGRSRARVRLSVGGCVLALCRGGRRETHPLGARVGGGVLSVGAGHLRTGLRAFSFVESPARSMATVFSHRHRGAGVGRVAVASRSALRRRPHAGASGHLAPNGPRRRAAVLPAAQGGDRRRLCGGVAVSRRWRFLAWAAGALERRPSSDSDDRAALGRAIRHATVASSGSPHLVVSGNRHLRALFRRSAVGLSTVYPRSRLGLRMAAAGIAGIAALALARPRAGRRRC